jgi:hypothetical protein
MRRRTITEREISLIKAMLARRMKNKDIQFFFNRPDRPVNSGRISTIRTGSYSDSVEIMEASDEELDAFMQSWPLTRGHAEPTIADKARELFGQGSDGRWILTDGENQECECKQDFDSSKTTPLVRAVAALANNKGGFIFFGVLDGDYVVRGVSKQFSQTDVVQIVDKVKAHLSPTPNITAKGIIEFDGAAVGFLHVAKYPNPPVIVYRAGDGLNEGEILFRYPGQSSRIKFGDLRQMLDERDRRAQLALAGAVGRIADVGPSNALIVDTNKNILEAKGHSILIDQKLAETLKFVKEGEFDEKLGAPTLKLVGEVLPVSVKGTGTKIVAHAAIFQESILEKFLDQAEVDQPIQYIYAGLAQSRLWLPVFYYARMSGESNARIAALVEGLKISQKGKKKMLIERLERTKSAFAAAVTKAARKYAGEISKGIVTVPTKVDEVMPFTQGLTAVKKTTATLEVLLSSVRSCKDVAEAADNGNAIGAVFKAACRIDEMFFAD